MQMMFTTAVEISHLFDLGKHILKFAETLDQLKQTYAALKEQGNTSDNKTYLLAIHKATPEQYSWVTSQLAMMIDHYNSMLNITVKKVMTPQLLITELRQVFTTLVAQHKQTGIGADHLPRSECHHPYFIHVIKAHTRIAQAAITEAEDVNMDMAAT